MNVFIILSLVLIVIGIISTIYAFYKEVLVTNQKTKKEKFLMFIFYSILVYLINIIFWIIKLIGAFCYPVPQTVIY